MTITQIHRPAVSVADRLHTAARLVEALGDPGTGILTVTVYGDGGIAVQVLARAGAALERQVWVHAAAAILAAKVHTEVYGPEAAPHWGSYRVAGAYDGIGVEVFTPLDLDEARRLGLAVCAGCSHTDHDGDTCLAAMVDANGDDRACECGRPDAEAILLAGGVISDFDVAAAQAIALVNGDRHEERCEASDDDLRDAAAERDTR